MDQFRIEGGVPLRGEVQASGSKNSALALMAAALLTDEPVTLSNTPRVRDLETMAKILAGLGIKSGWETADALRIDGGTPTEIEAPYDLVRTMRASFMVLGPLLARCGHARVSLPGGCAIGARPVDQHLKGMAALGAKIELDGGYVEARADRLRGARVVFDVRTVNGTQNVLMAACLADGVSEIENAACEPEVLELITVLRAMGARIDQASSEHLIVQGVSSLSGLRHTVAGDRIEAGTLLVCGGLVAGGDVKVTGIIPEHSGVVLEKLREAGLDVEVGSDWARLRRHGSFRGLRVKTAPFPGFATDMQAQMMALLSVADGTSVITDTVYLDRFTHVPELLRLGAQIRLEGNVATITGVEHLQGAPVMATDIRASAALVLAALVAEGETRISRIYHLDRGYERLDEKLEKLGARVRRVQD
jgi:UDP-N-acetylglucosamine 1-carboxyvinyltransferase